MSASLRGSRLQRLPSKSWLKACPDFQPAPIEVFHRTRNCLPPLSYYSSGKPGSSPDHKSYYPRFHDVVDNRLLQYYNDLEKGDKGYGLHSTCPYSGGPQADQIFSLVFICQIISETIC